MYMVDSALEPSYNLSKTRLFIVKKRNAMDTEIDGRYGKWFNPPEYGSQNRQLHTTSHYIM